MRRVSAGVLTGFAFLAVTAIAAVIEPLPVELASSHHAKGIIVEDSNGRMLGQCRDGDYRLASPVRLAEVPLVVRRAVLAAEDARFYRHRGVDPLAVVRAAWQLLRSRRIISGGSTITQQLARTLVPRPRTFLGKWREMVVSLRIETSLDKDAILEAYLNQVPFGPTTRGIAAAAEEYFGKPVSALSLAEASTIAALPRGPTRYHPARHLARLQARREQVLLRMSALNWASAGAVELARHEPIVPRGPLARNEAPHLVRALTQGRLGLGALWGGRASRLRTTLDRELQQTIEKLVTDARGQLTAAGASAASIVVLDNQRAELLAYVGSTDFFDAESLGQNDGCLALRQPGSALKPFLYAAAIEWLGMESTTQLADVETHFKMPTGEFTPKNYDGRYRGLVLLRDALGSSLNVPAVQVAERVGVERFWGLLHRLGFESLSAPASHYGLALALGDGEVRLLELALAYSALSRHGLYRPLRVVSEWTDASGLLQREPVVRETRVLSEATAWQLLEILADDSARGSSFGRHGVLNMSIPVAAKTGTSSNHRDNWAVGVTHEVTVAVWVGNFDGRPLAHGTTGVVGAAPLLRSALEASMRQREPAPLFPQDRLQSRRVCKISGQKPGPDCRAVVEVHGISGRGAERTCELHRRLRIDPQNGLLAGPTCTGAIEQVFEQYQEAFRVWASSAGRPVPPNRESPRCPGALFKGATTRVTITNPIGGATYLIDPHLPEWQQALTFGVTASGGIDWVEYAVDTSRSGRRLSPFEWRWPLRRGHHHLVVTTSHGVTDELDFDVN